MGAALKIEEPMTQITNTVRTVTDSHPYVRMQLAEAARRNALVFGGPSTSVAFAGERAFIMVDDQTTGAELANEIAKGLALQSLGPRCDDSHSIPEPRAQREVLDSVYPPVAGETLAAAPAIRSQVKALADRGCRIVMTAGRQRKPRGSAVVFLTHAFLEHHREDAPYSAEELSEVLDRIEAERAPLVERCLQRAAS